MAIDQDGVPEDLGRAANEKAKRPVIGLVEPFDPVQRLVDGEAGAIDLLPVGHDPRDRAEPAGHAHRARVGEGRQAAVEHARVELVGLPVEVQIGARKAGGHERRAQIRHRSEQLVHEGILGAPQGHGVEPGCGQEGGRIHRARMRHVEDEGDRLRRRFGDGEGRIELVDDGWTHQDIGCFGDEAGARISVRMGIPLSMTIS
jgi:hypothetical protein